MGYEIFLILPAIYLVTKGVASSMLTVRSRLTVKLVSYFLYFFFFLVWPSPVGFSFYTCRPYFRGVRSMKEVERIMSMAGKNIMKKLGFEEVRRDGIVKSIQDGNKSDRSTEYFDK